MPAAEAAPKPTPKPAQPASKPASKVLGGVGTAASRRGLGTRLTRYLPVSYIPIAICVADLMALRYSILCPFCLKPMPTWAPFARGCRTGVTSFFPQRMRSCILLPKMARAEAPVTLFAVISLPSTNWYQNSSAPLIRTSFHKPASEALIRDTVKVQACNADLHR